MKMDKNEMKKYLVNNLRISTRVNNGTITIKLFIQDDVDYKETFICEDYISIYDINREIHYLGD